MRMLAALVICCSTACTFGQTTRMGSDGTVATATPSAAAPVYGKPVVTEIENGRMITYPSGGRDIPAYLVTPKLAGTTAGAGGSMPSVIIVSDIFGMTPWIKTQADALARQGYEVIVPNLYSRLPGSDKGLDAQQAWLAYDQTADAQIHDDLAAAVDYLQEDGKPTADQPVGIVGYDMGGIYAMMLAGTDLRVSAAVNYYGRVVYNTTSRNRPISPVEDLFNLRAPLLSFYGNNDPQVPASQIAALDSRLSHNPNQTFYEIVRYPDVGHGFLVPTRQGYNAAAATAATEKTRDFLARYLRAEPKKLDE
jgi:carboxymethylenebutenolidase